MPVLGNRSTNELWRFLTYTEHGFVKTYSSLATLLLILYPASSGWLESRQQVVSLWSGKGGKIISLSLSSFLAQKPPERKRQVNRRKIGETQENRVTPLNGLSHYVKYQF